MKRLKKNTDEQRRVGPKTQLIENIPSTYDRIDARQVSCSIPSPLAHFDDEITNNALWRFSPQSAERCPHETG